jgi:DNA-binding NarL/FixJ family response regulator
VSARVLIVDDHESFRRLARRLLVACGFTVVGEAADAASAIRQVAALDPDVVLLDLVLPDGSGIDVARALAAVPRPPRVVLTSSRSRSDFGSGFEWPGGCEFIPKHRLSAVTLGAVLGER